MTPRVTHTRLPIREAKKTEVTTNVHVACVHAKALWWGPCGARGSEVQLPGAVLRALHCTEPPPRFEQRPAPV